MYVEIYTDGACSGNPGPGGWSAILRYGNYEKRISGGQEFTTNNRMEMTAIIEALLCMKKTDVPIKIISDSCYVLNNIERLPEWKSRNWHGTRGQIKNQDLWQAMDRALAMQQNIEFVHVYGHTGVQYNELCDKMAREQTSLYKKRSDALVGE